jgi:hypothetical protein
MIADAGQYGPQANQVEQLLNELTRKGRFGPQTEQVEALIADLRALASDQVTELAAARHTAGTDARHAARRAAMTDHGCYASWYPTWAATWSASTAHVDYVDDGAIAGDVAGFAAVALATRHLIGQYGYTQSHYDALTGRVAEVLGRPLHPDDQPPAPNRAAPNSPEDQS